MSRSALLAAGVVLVLAWAMYVQVQAQSIKGSRHDFSATSGAASKAQSETQVCIFCHTPHSGNPKGPLWNHKLSGRNYTTNSDPGLGASGPQSGDSTKLCLGCHDGTVALGDTVNNGRIAFRDGGAALAANRRSNMGTNLADDHPVAFKPDYRPAPGYPQVSPPPPRDAVKLDPSGRMQCVTCHDPHDEFKDPTEQRFLVKANTESAICTACHALQSTPGAPVTWSWGTVGQVSDHKTSPSTYTFASSNPGGSDSNVLGAHTGYTTTAQNGCAACHRSHTAHGSKKLLKGDTDQICFQCHDGNATTNIEQNIKAAFAAKLYRHPGTDSSQSGHDPGESPIISGSRHSTCADCHNAHAARGSRGISPVPPEVSPALVGVSGVTATGAALNPRQGSGEAAYEYQICFQCHADSINKPQNRLNRSYGPTPFRATFGPGQDQVNYNLRLQFQSTGVASRHPVTQPAVGSVSPSLRTYMRNLNDTANTQRRLGAGLYIYCTDCHNNDQGRAFSGSGPNGPHGSAQPHLLERNYAVNSLAAGQGPGGALNQLPHPPASGPTGTYGLCEKCHKINSSTGGCNLSTSPLHSFHSTSNFGFSCSTCHAPHGVYNGTINNQGLVNFDLNLVAANQASSYPVPTAIRSGNSATCNLQCHGVLHGKGGVGSMPLFESSCAY